MGPPRGPPHSFPTATPNTLVDGIVFSAGMGDGGNTVQRDGVAQRAGRGMPGRMHLGFPA
ncbi:hypothetical protein AGMMS49940_02990 [Spirochaetia bacterium]|nr:hypothetical protein AGMMS49940_02990 [Spirochaetia bacterium]